MKIPVTIAIVFCLSVSCKKKEVDDFHTLVEIEKEELNIAYGAHVRHKMDIYFPEGFNTNTPVVFLIHGGGYYEGSKESFTPRAKRFCQEGFVVVNLEHRLINTDGLFENPPRRVSSDVNIAEVLKDIDKAVDYYKSIAPDLGTGVSGMFMAGHSAGAISSMLYVPGNLNADGDIKASGNWGGTSDFSSFVKPAEADDLDEQVISFFRELLWRWTGSEPKQDNTLAYMAHAPYWVASQNGCKPNISIMPEANDPFSVGSEISSLRNVKNYHQLIASKGVYSAYLELPGENHGFEKLADSWNTTIRETANFFKRVKP